MSVMVGVKMGTMDLRKFLLYRVLSPTLIVMRKADMLGRGKRREVEEAVSRKVQSSRRMRLLSKIVCSLRYVVCIEESAKLPVLLLCIAGFVARA